MATWIGDVAALHNAFISTSAVLAFVIWFFWDVMLCRYLSPDVSGGRISVHYALPKRLETNNGSASRLRSLYLHQHYCESDKHFICVSIVLFLLFVSF
jgi:hypothetical protein